MMLSLLAVPASAVDSGADLLKTAEFYLTFEEGIKDDMGRHTFESDGDVPSVDGIFGKGIATDSDNYYIYYDDVVFGADSWTLTSWVKIDNHAGDPCLFSNKDWNSGGNPGWLICVRDGDWKINGNPNAWTISVSADGENWTELAKGDDSFFEETNFTYYAGDAAAEGVSYVKFEAASTAANLFQVSELNLLGEKTGELGAADEALDDKAEAPQTFDFGVTAAVAAVISLGGFALAKKKH